MVVFGVLRGFMGMVLLVAGCATAQTSPDGAPDGPLPPDANVDGPVDAPLPDAAPPSDGGQLGPGFFLDDTAQDFTGTVFDQAFVAAWGAIEPTVYYTGGLLAAASDTDTFSNGAAAAWVDVEAMTPTGVATISRHLDFDWGTGTPTGLALTSGDTWTIALFGEIYLTPGVWALHFLVDDHGFVELAQPGTASFVRVVSADTNDSNGNFTVATEGWHPIRIAASEVAGAARLRLQATPPGGNRGAISRHLLRARVDGIAGLYMAAFDDSYLLGGHATTVDAINPADHDWMTTMPGDVGVTDGDYFSVRWAGQLRVDTTGVYIYRLVTDDGQRMWIDGTLVLDAWDETSHDNMTASMTLEAGWHDVVIDQMEITGSARANLTIASGPEGSGAALPVAKLRPLVTRRQRYDTSFNRTDYPIPDLGSVDATVVLDAPAGAKVDGLSVSWTFDHSYHDDLEIRLIAPDGSTAVLRDNTGGSASGVTTQRLEVSALNTSSVRGTWTLRVSDTASIDTGTLQDFQITVRHSAGTPPVPALSSYESAVKDLGAGTLQYDTLSWLARVPAGTSVQLRVRSAGTEAALDTTEWSPPILNPSGGSPPVPARRYFQYRIELISDGDGVPSVDWVRLDYTVDAS